MGVHPAIGVPHLWKPPCEDARLVKTGFNGHDSGTDLLEVPTVYKA